MEGLRLQISGLRPMQGTTLKHLTKKTCGCFDNSMCIHFMCVHTVLNKCFCFTLLLSSFYLPFYIIHFLNVIIRKQLMCYDEKIKFIQKILTDPDIAIQNELTSSSYCEKHKLFDCQIEFFYDKYFNLNFYFSGILLVAMNLLFPSVSKRSERFLDLTLTQPSIDSVQTMILTVRNRLYGRQSTKGPRHLYNSKVFRALSFQSLR